MRILHVVKSYQSVGGIERYVRDLVAKHRARGHCVNILTVGTGRSLQVIDEEGGKIYFLPRLLTYQSATISLQFPSLLLRLSRQHDIVHFHYPNPCGELSYLAISPFLRVPTITTFHNEVVPTKRFYRIYRPLGRRFLELMDRIIVTSPNQLKTSAILQGLEEKTTVIPLGIPMPEMSPQSSTSLFPPQAFPRILFVGRLSRYKGLPYLIEAMQSAPGHLLIVGDGPLRTRLEAQVRELGLEERIVFTGYVPEEILWRLYHEADILVLPSIDRGEGFGYVILEAMAASTAIVSTELGTGTSYVNQHGETGFVVPKQDASALAQAIRQLAEDPDLLRKFKEKARERVRRFFTLDQMVDKIEQEYISLLEGRRR